MVDHDSQSTDLIVDAVVIDYADNAIRLQVPGYPGLTGPALDAVLDVGANGRLIGLEIDDRYISVMTPPDTEESYTRSADVVVSISADSPPWIRLPRRGSGYEITYPSGNECWQMKSVDGDLIQVCAVRAARAPIDAAPEALHDALARRTIPDLPPGTDPGSHGQR